MSYPYRKLGLSTKRGLPFWARWFPILQHKHRSAYLSQSGWYESVKQGMAVDEQGQPIPWYTYPFLDFIRPHLYKDGAQWRVYEYGCGHSTLWWAKHAKHVDAQEHDAKWRLHIQNILDDNKKLSGTTYDVDASNKETYAQAIDAPQEKFHIIVIDSKNRNTCAKVAPNFLTDDGVIIWDDSERVSNKQGLKHLHKIGFKSLHFIGIGPIHAQPSRTTLFYRPQNIFDI